MMKAKMILAAAAAVALVGGYQGFAESFILSDVTMKGTQLTDDAYTGIGDNAALTVTAPESGTSNNGVILKQGSSESKITFSSLDSFNFENNKYLAQYIGPDPIDPTKTGGMGVIVTVNEASVSFQDVKDIQLGTSENWLNLPVPYNNNVLGAYSGKISIDGADNVNIYSVGGAIMAQQQSNDKAGHVDINAKNVNINVDGEGVGAVTSAVFATGQYINPEETTSLNINASDSIHINCNGTNETGVQISDYYKNIQAEGNANLTLHAGNDIEISAQKAGGYGVMIYRKGLGGNSALDITSDQGNVEIKGSDVGLIAKGTAAAHISGVIQGKEVTVSASNGSGISLDTAADIDGEEINGLTLRGDTINVSGTTALYAQNGSVLNLQGTGSSSVINLTSTAENGNAINAAGGSQVTLGDGKTAADVNINGYINVSGADSQLTFADKTTTHVDSKYLTNEKQAFITTGGTGTVTFGEDAKLDIGDIKTGTALNFSDDTALNKAAANAIKTGNVLQQVTFEDDKGITVRMVDKEQVSNLLEGTVLQNVAYYATQNNNDGIKALVESDNPVEALNSAAGLASMANVAHGTYTMNGIFSDAVSGHLMNRQDQDVWAYGFHSKENVNGLSFGADYDAQYNGIAAGVDFYRKGGTTAGLALIYADSNVSGANGVSSTKNDADYYGVSLYSRFDRGSYALLGDISYMKGDHDITQVNSGETITASPDSDSISVGVKAVKDYAAGENGTLTPYVGLRYLRLSTDDFTASNGLHYEGDDQDLVIVPVGVNYTAAISHGKWSVRPYAGIGYVWTAGDRSADQTVMLGTAADSFSYDTADSGSFIARAGVTTDCGDMSYGIGYSWQKGDSVSNNAWTLSASYHF